jgi:hypothetical protein
MLLYVVLSPGAIAEQSTLPAKAVVEELYRDYAWVILIDEPSLANLIDQPEKELKKYFTEPLANMILRDRQCARKTKDLCRLDFDPIYDSQDPDGAHQLHIEQMNLGYEVKVTFIRRWSSSSDIAELHFRMKKTPMGWRIDDIDYGNHESLRSILQRDIPAR